MAMFARSKLLSPTLLLLLIIGTAHRYGVSGSTFMLQVPRHDSTMPLAVTACPATIAFGMIMQCAISTAGESDRFSFNGAGNDRLMVRVARITGELNPAVHIYNSAGRKVCSEFTSDNIVDINNCRLPGDDQYRLVVEDTYQTESGDYHLYVQRLNNPGNARSIAFGETLAGRIDLIAEADTFTFAGLGGVSIRVTMTRTSGDLRPRIRLYAADGTLLCSAFSSAQTTEIGSCTLPQAARYTLILDDTGGRTGAYEVSLACLDNECALRMNLKVYLPGVSK